MMNTYTITFDYEDFNTTTSRSHDTRSHGTATVHTDAFGEGVYIMGKMGCGKTRQEVRDALVAYLGGRRLLSFRVFN
jgi:hypothetical protein